MARRQVSRRAGIEPRLQRTAGRIYFAEERRLIARRDDEHAEQERWIQGLDFEFTLGARPGALAAIRITGGSEKADTQSRTRSVDKSRRAGDRLAVLPFNDTRQIGALDFTLWANGCGDQGSRYREQPEQVFHLSHRSLPASGTDASAQFHQFPKEFCRTFFRVDSARSFRLRWGSIYEREAK